MRVFYLSIVFLAISFFQHVAAQQGQSTTVSGVLLTTEGEPLPGANIVIKGTNQGTTTDINGFYSLEAPVGATLVVSFIGYTSYEVKVTGPVSGKGNTQSPMKKEAQLLKSFPVPTAVKQEPGVAVLSDSSGGYEVEGSNGTYGQRMLGPLATIRQRNIHGKPGLLLVPAYIAQRRRPKIRLEYTTALNRSVANKLSELQRSYGQGRSVGGEYQARGPEDQELFSWGPSLESLTRAQVYDPYQVLRPGIASENHLQVFSEVSDFSLRAGYGYKSAQGIIPENRYDRHAIDFSGRLNNYPLRPRLFMSYSQAEEQLPQRGANLAAVLGSMYTTPPDFDLIHGVSGNKPWRNPSSYLNAQGEELSYAPGLVNHPFWLVNQLPDAKNEEKFLAGLELKTDQVYPLRLHYNLVFDQQYVVDGFGIPPSSAAFAPGRLSERKHRTREVNSNINTAIDLDLYSSVWKIDVYAAYLFNYKQERLLRQDGLGFMAAEPYVLEQAEVFRELSLEPFRRQHELITKTNISFSGNNYYQFLKLALANSMYFSNTLAAKPAYFLPSATLLADFNGFDFIQQSGFISRAKMYVAYSASIQEAPLLYNQWHFNSLAYTPANYRRYYEEIELTPDSWLLPEEQQKWELGAEMSLFNGLLDLKANYFRNTTENFILPVQQATGFELMNVAEVVSPGLELTLAVNGYFNEGSWNAGLTFSRNRPRVKSIYLSQEDIPIAGFQSISTNLREGEPVGVILGSQYLRNEAGGQVIGKDGFPMLAAEPGIIGNPNPDWLAAINGSLQYKHFGFSLLVDGRKGGDVWNGTQQFLNFYGRSPLTARERDAEGYVDMNRWQRYGEAGVGEDGIKEASLIRINEIQLSYNLSAALEKLLGNNRIDKVKLSLLARNLLLYTSYTGLDPAGNLFGYQHARGLDLFNQPNTRSLGFALTLTY